MSLCDKCVSGVRHEGTPAGTIEVLDGVRTYIATPTGQYDKTKAVLLLPDVFGIDLINTQLLADDFARNGLKVYAVDYFDGDPLPDNALNTTDRSVFMAWLAKHDVAVTRPPLNRVVAAVKEQGVTELAATGYCFGARYVFDLAIEKIIKVAAVSHPSFLKIPEDLQAIKESRVPLLINSCETDNLFPIEDQARADEILGGGTQESELYKREYFPGCTHGFAVRGDMSDPKVKAGKEGAFKAIVEYFWRHL